MPQFDLRGIKAGKYTNTQGVITYADSAKVGDAMTANVELEYADGGELYAESNLSEYLKPITGGSISLGVKDLSSTVRQMLYGNATKTRSITIGETTSSVEGLVIGGNDASNYVGVAFYAPGKVDGVYVYTCVFVRKCLFGQPSMTYQTKSKSITWQTPTTSGKFMADETSDVGLVEIANVATEALAKAWVDLVLGVDD